jgi:hypothetical protein
MIESSYGKWIGGSQGFGEAALKAAKPKPSPKPREAEEIDFEQMQVVGMAERGGFEPPVPLLGVHTISSRAPSTARSPLRIGTSSTYVPCPTFHIANVSKMSPAGVLKYFSSLAQRNIGGKDELRSSKTLRRVTRLRLL